MATCNKMTVRHMAPLRHIQDEQDLHTHVLVHFSECMRFEHDAEQ